MMKKLYDEGDDEMKRTIAKVCRFSIFFFSPSNYRRFFCSLVNIKSSTAPQTPLEAGIEHGTPSKFRIVICNS